MVSLEDRGSLFDSPVCCELCFLLFVSIPYSVPFKFFDNMFQISMDFRVEAVCACRYIFSKSATSCVSRYIRWIAFIKIVLGKNILSSLGSELFFIL